jgi:hypothetical protein
MKKELDLTNAVRGPALRAPTKADWAEYEATVLDCWACGRTCNIGAIMDADGNCPRCLNEIEYRSEYPPPNITGYVVDMTRPDGTPVSIEFDRTAADEAAAFAAEHGVDVREITTNHER